MTHGLRHQDSDQRAGTRTGDAREKVFPAHAGVDDDRHGTELEKGESSGDERQALPHHHQRAVTPADSGGGQAAAPGADLGVELGKAEREVVDITGARATAGDFERGGIGPGGGHEREVARDIGVGGRFDGLRAGGRRHGGETKARAKTPWRK